MAIMACLYVYVYVECSCEYEGFGQRKNVQLTELYIFQSEVVHGNVFEHFATVVNVRVWCGLCCMLVEKENAQGKINPIKSRTNPPKYRKILSSSSSTFFTMTASLEGF